jgi:polyhydroxyalkanoate synthesis regulator phasin
MDELKKLTKCGDAWAEQRAQMALDLSDQLSRGDLSRDEYQELMQDLVRTDVLSQCASSIETKTALIKAVNVAMMLV